MRRVGMHTGICPICGANVGEMRLSTWHHDQHRCAERTIRGIDATLSVEDREPQQPSLNKRLRDGFNMIGDDEYLDY